MSRARFTWLLPALLVQAAAAATLPLPPPPPSVVFANGFEGNFISATFSGWDNIHVDPGNSLAVSQTRVREGTQSLMAYCLTGGGSSKAEIQRDGLRVAAGQLTRVEWSVYIDADHPFGRLYLADLEDTSYPKSPGPRVFAESDDSLAVELKGPSITLSQTYPYRVPLPTRRWVDLAWTIVPSTTSGWVWLEQDGVVVLQGAMPTIASVGDQVLDRLGVGCTANSSTKAVRQYVDRVRVLQ